MLARSNDISDRYNVILGVATMDPSENVIAWKQQLFENPFIAQRARSLILDSGGRIESTMVDINTGIRHGIDSTQSTGDSLGVGKDLTIWAVYLSGPATWHMELVDQGGPNQGSAPGVGSPEIRIGRILLDAAQIEARRFVDFNYHNRVTRDT